MVEEGGIAMKFYLAIIEADDEKFTEPRANRLLGIMQDLKDCMIGCGSMGFYAVNDAEGMKRFKEELKRVSTIRG